MLIRLISLAILLLFIDTNQISLADENFILPKDKPSVFKKIEKPRATNKDLLPESKPIIKTESIKKKEESKEKVKLKVKEEKIVKKVEKKITNNSFLLPQKKPKTIRKTTASAKKSKFLNQKDFDFHTIFHQLPHNLFFLKEY